MDTVAYAADVLGQIRGLGIRELGGALGYIRVDSGVEIQAGTICR